MASSTPLLQQHNKLFFTFSSKYTNSLFCFSNSSLSYVTKSLASTSSSLFSSPFQSSHPLVRLTRVSTAPVEYVPPAPDFDFHKEIARLKDLKSKLDNCTNLKDRIRVIDSDSRVNSFFYSHKNSFSRVLDTLHLDKHEVFLLKCVVAAGQQHIFGNVCTEFDATRSSLKSAFYALAEMIENWDVNDGIRSSGVNVYGLGAEEFEALRSMLKIIEEVERFYDCIGGIIGLQKVMRPAKGRDREPVRRLSMLAQADCHSSHVSKPISHLDPADRKYSEKAAEKLSFLKEMDGNLHGQDYNRSSGFLDPQSDYIPLGRHLMPKEAFRLERLWETTQEVTSYLPLIADEG